MKQVFIIGLLLAGAITVQAQATKAEIEDRIEARRIAYITEAMDLTATEAQSFWPVFNAYKKEQRTLRENIKSKEDSDSENLNSIFEHDSLQLELKKEYASKIEQIIGSSRTINLLKADRKFKEKLVKGLKQKHKKHSRGW